MHPTFPNPGTAVAVAAMMTGEAIRRAGRRRLAAQALTGRTSPEPRWIPRS